jgi:hypothetical protein
MSRVADQDEVVKIAIQKILADRKSWNTSLNYAVNYCRVAICLEGDALAVQCLYILNNIIHWRHEDAKEVRAVLKNYVKMSGK